MDQVKRLHTKYVDMDRHTRGKGSDTRLLAARRTESDALLFLSNLLLSAGFIHVASPVRSLRFRARSSASTFRSYFILASRKISARASSFSSSCLCSTLFDTKCPEVGEGLGWGEEDRMNDRSGTHHNTSVTFVQQMFRSHELAGWMHLRASVR